MEIVQLIIGAFGTIPKSIKRNLEELGAYVAPGLLQRSDGLLRRQDAAWRTHTIKYHLIITVYCKTNNNINK